MDQKDIDEINEMIKIRDMDMNLADDIDDYVRAATWTPKEINILLDMIRPWGSSDLLVSILFDDEPPLEDGHDLVAKLWKLATQRPLEQGTEDKEAYNTMIRYYNQAIGALDTKFNKIPILLSSRNRLVVTLVKWRIKLGR